MRTLVGDRSSVGIREQTLATLERKLTEWVSGQRSAQTLCARVPVSVTQSRCPRLLLRASRLCRRFASTCARPARGARGCLFLLKSYKNMKAASPATPILIREASGVEGGLVARVSVRAP